MRHVRTVRLSRQYDAVAVFRPAHARYPAGPYNHSAERKWRGHPPLGASVVGARIGWWNDAVCR
jgi:hypothetical protein